MRKLVCTAVLLAATALSAPAQTTPGSGTRVRVLAPSVSDDRLVGLVASSTPDTLLLSVSGGSAVYRLSLDSIRTLEASRGRDRLKWSVLGAGAGFLAGGVIGAAWGGHDDASGWGGFLGMMGGVMLGTPTGAVAGALFAPERWVRFDLPRSDD